MKLRMTTVVCGLNWAFCHELNLDNSTVEGRRNAFVVSNAQMTFSFPTGDMLTIVHL